MLRFACTPRSIPPVSSDETSPPGATSERRGMSRRFTLVSVPAAGPVSRKTRLATVIVPAAGESCIGGRSPPAGRHGRVGATPACTVAWSAAMRSAAPDAGAGRIAHQNAQRPRASECNRRGLPDSRATEARHLDLEPGMRADRREATPRCTARAVWKIRGTIPRSSASW